MEQQTFADGIGRIAIIDGIVRLDLIAHSATETDPTGKPRAVFVGRIVMGMDQFLRASEKIVETVRAIQQARQPGAPNPPMPAPTAQRPQPVPAPQAPAAQVPPQYRRESIRPEPPAAPATPPAQPFP